MISEPSFRFSRPGGAIQVLQLVFLSFLPACCTFNCEKGPKHHHTALYSTGRVSKPRHRALGQVSFWWGRGVGFSFSDLGRRCIFLGQRAFSFATSFPIQLFPARWSGQRGLLTFGCPRSRLCIFFQFVLTLGLFIWEMGIEVHTTGACMRAAFTVLLLWPLDERDKRFTTCMMIMGGIEKWAELDKTPKSTQNMCRR